MKHYLFGLGTMLVGAGLMFVLMHGEVSADIGKVYSKLEQFVCSGDLYALSYEVPSVFYCKTKALGCAIACRGISCIKQGGLF